MITVVLYVTLASCAFLAGWLVYRYDMYEREPWYMVLLAVALGFAAMYLIGATEAEDRLLRYLGEMPRPAAFALVAAVVEELTRLVLVMGLALLIRSQFNDPMDGIIYGCLIGLGMAVEESVFELRRLVQEQQTYLPPNEIMRLLGHLILGGITGFAVGMFRMRMRHWFAALVGCVLGSMMLHFIWDLIAFHTRALGHSPAWVKACTVLLMFICMGFFGYLVVLASEWSRLIFAPQQPSRLWGWPFSLLMRQRDDAGE